MQPGTDCTRFGAFCRRALVWSRRARGVAYPGHVPSVPFPSAPSGPSDPPNADPTGSKKRCAVYRNRVAPGGERKCGRSGRSAAPTAFAAGTDRQRSEESTRWQKTPAVMIRPGLEARPRDPRPRGARCVSSHFLSKLLWDSCKTPQFDFPIIPQIRRIVKWKFREMRVLGVQEGEFFLLFRDSRTGHNFAFAVSLSFNTVMECDGALMNQAFFAVCTEIFTVIHDLLFENCIFIYTSFDKYFQFGSWNLLPYRIPCVGRFIFVRNLSSYYTKIRHFFLRLGVLTKILPCCHTPCQIQGFVVY